MKPGQWAVFVKGGQILDVFSEGTHSLQTNNLPLLTTLISLPFGGQSPFQAEVWFINKLSKLNNLFGTATPLQLEDPKYGIIIPVRAFGSFGIRVSEPRLFLETLVGTARVFGAEKIVDYFRGRILSAVSRYIGEALTLNNISVVQIAARTETISEFCRDRIAGEFQKHGLDVVNFFFQSINVPVDDPSYQKLKQIKEKQAELNIIGRDVYQFDRNMNVLQTAASNKGTAGSLMQAGIGLGLGSVVGSQMGDMAGRMVTELPTAGTPPPVPIPEPPHQYHVAVDGQPLGPFEIPLLRRMIETGKFEATALVWTSGMASWQSAATVPDLVACLPPQSPDAPPPLPPRI